MARKIQYYVEGKCEEKLINELKKVPNCFIKPGKVCVYNIISQIIENDRIALLDPKTTIILVYDIDVENIDILKQNVDKLKKLKFRVVHIQSINCFEDELVYSSSLNNINEMFNTKTKKEFKKAFLKQKDLSSKLKQINFNVNKIWTRTNNKAPFNRYSSSKDNEFIKEK